MDRNKSSTAGGMNQGVNGKSMGIITSAENWKSDTRGNKEQFKRQTGVSSGKNSKIKVQHHQQTIGTGIKFAGMQTGELRANNNH